MMHKADFCPKKNIDIIEILLKVALNTITLPPSINLYLATMALFLYDTVSSLVIC